MPILSMLIYSVVLQEYVNAEQFSPKSQLTDDEDDQSEADLSSGNKDTFILEVWRISC